jgi:hypothetical protein
MRIVAVFAASAGLATFGFGQLDLLGPGQYPQFRTLSGLPGGGSAVLPNGNPGFGGALSLSTPIGYSLSNWHIVRVGSVTSDYGWFRLPNLSAGSIHIDSNSKGAAMIGASLGRFGSVTFDMTLISAQLDTAFNAQYQLPIHYHDIGFSLGIQDIGNNVTDRSASFAPPRLGSRSIFGVVTAPIGRGIYASAGYGDRRFDKGFANISAPLGPRFKLMIEHDGFNFNEAVAWDPRVFQSIPWLHRAKMTVMAGYIRSKYAYWSIGVAY